MQIFRDDSRRRWRRLQIAFALLGAALLFLMFAFAKTLRPHQAAILAPAPPNPAVDVAAIQSHALDLAHASPIAPVEVGAGVAAISPAASAPATTTSSTLDARIGFVDATEEEALHAIEAHGSSLTHVAIEGLHVKNDAGEFLGQISDDALARAKDKGLAILEVLDDVRDDVPHPEDMTALGRDRARARKLAIALQSRLHADGAAGVVLALGQDDADPDGSLRSVVLEEIAARLKAAGFVVATRDDAHFVPEALAKEAAIADLVMVAASRGLDPKSAPMPLATRKFIDGTIASAAKIVPASKLVIVLPTRAGAWPVLDDGTKIASVGDARELQWGEVLARARTADVTPRWDPETANLLVALPGYTGIASSPYVRAFPTDADGVGMVAWFVDGATFADDLSLARAHGVNKIGIATLGGEDPRVWKVLALPPGDREAVRAALVKVPHPEQPDVIGDGVAMKVDMTQHDGATSIDFGIGGRIESEHYDALPAAPTVVRRGRVPDRTVVLTFDDGPTPEYTPQILDILKEEGVKATFFVVGSMVEREPELLRREVAEGNEIGNHSFSHPDLGKISAFDADLEINSTNRLIEALTGRSTILLRPPFRSDDRPTVFEDLAAIEHGERNGMIAVTSNLDPHDWARPAPDVIVDYLSKRVDKFNGGVILMHDGGGDRKNTVAALKPLIERLRLKGYTFAQVHQIFGDASVDVVNPPVQQKLDARVSKWLWITGTWILRGLTGLAIFALALGIIRWASLTIFAVLETISENKERREIRRESRLPNHNAVSVIVPAYNEAKVIERTILSILNSRGVEVEVLVMDDGSTDETAEIVSKAFYIDPRVKLHRLANGGKARALNQGFELASHDIVVALDADTIFLPDTIIELVRKFDDPRVAAVAGRAAVGNTQHFIGRWQALEYVVGQAIERRAWHLLGIVSVVPGAVGAWHRDAVLLCGGFGTDTLAEDCDLAITLQVEGFRVAYAPNAVALTEAPESVRALLKQRFRWCFGVLQTMWKHRSTLWRPTKDNRLIGWVLMPAIFLCHLGTPLLAPLADLAAIVAIALGHGKVVVPYFLVLLVSELLLTLVAIRLDRARFSLMWDWLVNRSLYRWILFGALCKAVFAALRGGAVGWGKLVRTGTVEAPRGAVTANASSTAKTAGATPQSNGKHETQKVTA